MEEKDQIVGVIRVSNCSEDGVSGVVFPRLGIASPAAIETLLGRALDERARAVLNAGGAVLVSAGVMDHGTMDVVRLPRRSAGDDPGALVPVAELPAVQVAAMPQYTELPVAFVSPHTAEHLGLDRGAEPAHALLVPGYRSNPPALSADEVQRVLPLRQQAAAEIVIAEGPSGLDVLRTITTALLIGTVMVGTTLIGSGVTLWGTESRPEMSRLTVVGAGRGWRLAAGSAQGASIAALACLVGVPPGAVAGVLFLGSVDVEPTVPGAAVVIGRHLAGSCGAWRCRRASQGCAYTLAVVT